MQDVLNRSKKFSIENHWGIFLLLAMIVGYSCYRYIDNITFLNVINGYTPIEWIYKLLHAKDFSLDGYSGFEAYTSSSVMYIYIIMQKFFNVTPEIINPLMIYVEVFFLAFAYLYLARTIIKDMPKIAVFILVLMVTISNALNINISHYLAPLYLGTFYNFSHAFGLIAIALWLRKKYFLSLLCIGVTFTIHPQEGLFPLVFMGFAQLVDPKVLLKPRVLFSGLCLIIIAGLWLYLTIQPSSLSQGEIPKDMWFSLTQLAGYHWYPVSYGLLSTYFAQPFFAFLSFSILLVCSLTYIKLPADIKKMIVAGFSGIILVTILGVIFSIYKLSPLLIKLSLHRSIEIVIRLGIILIVAYLYQTFRTGKFYDKSIVFMTLIIPFIFFIPYLLLNSALVARKSCLKVFKRQSLLWGDILVIAIILLMLILTVIYDKLGYGTGIMNNQNYHFAFYSLVGSVKLIKLLFLYAVCFFIFDNVKAFKKNHFSIYFLFIGVLFSVGIWIRNHSILDSNLKKQAEAYIDAQIWAKRSTPGGSLFFTDPADAFMGWRVYSKRSTVGHFSDWIYGWCYSVNDKAYYQGQEKVTDLGIALKDYLALDNKGLKAMSKLGQDIKQHFYALNDQQLKHLSEKYHFSYVVLEKAELKHNQESKLPVVYQNDYYQILAIPENL